MNFNQSQQWQPPKAPNTITMKLPGKYNKNWSAYPPRPIRRYVARGIDVGIFGILIWAAFIFSFLILSKALPSLDPLNHKQLDALMNNNVLFWVFQLFAIIPIAYYIGKRGDSPGKRILGVKVLRDGKAIGFHPALSREISVLFKGEALAIPPLNLFAHLWQCNRLCKNGYTSWDRKLSTVVIYKDISNLKLIAYVICTSFILAAAVTMIMTALVLLCELLGGGA